MTKKTATLIILLAGLMIFPSFILAGDSYTIRISCTIPVLPGINAPLVRDNIKEEMNPHTIFESNENQLRLIQGTQQVVSVKTIYSR